MVVTSWRPGAPQSPIRQRVASWRARNWRRAVLAWFVLVLAIMAVAAEPVRVTLTAVEALTVAGVPLLLIALP
jgi:hypothetical protein